LSFLQPIVVSHNASNISAICLSQYVLMKNIRPVLYLLTMHNNNIPVSSSQGVFALQDMFLLSKIVSKRVNQGW